MAMHLQKGVFCWIILGQSTLISHTRRLPHVDIFHFSSKFIVWISAFRNRHYMVAIVTLMVLLVLVFEPLSASTFVLIDTWWGPSRQYPWLSIKQPIELLITCH